MSPGGERIVEELKVWLLEERLGWANRIRGISDDDIIRRFVFSKEFEAIANEYFDFWRS